MKRFSLVVALSAIFLLAAASVASSTVRVLSSFKTEIDVKLKVTERSVWNGIQEGCYAPQESFDTALTARLDSTPGSKSKIKAGTTTLLPGSFGATSSYGAKSSFKQSAKSGMWDLQIQNPAGCDFPAPAAPSWATSPTCKKISERVMASLIQHDTDGDAGAQAKSTDGSLLIMRTPKASGKGKAGSIGESCNRTLHEIAARGIDSDVSFTSRSTFFQVPIPNLQSKLERLAEGSAKSRPSFKVSISIGGDCTEMKMKPSIGEFTSFQKSIGSFPRQALGNIFGDWSKSACMVSGSGRATIKRVGPVKGTTIPH